MVIFPKEIVIATLRERFKEDSFFRYSQDAWGFPNTPDHTDLPATAGLYDNVTSRLYVGENYRKDDVFYPALLVKHGGASYVPISLNRELGSIQWSSRVYQDESGNIKTFPVAEHFIFAGAWEGSVNIDVLCRSPKARDELVEIVSILFMDVDNPNLQKAGLAIKGVSASGASESDDRNDKLYRTTITLNVRTEWRRHVPIGNVIEVIQASVEFGRLDDPNSPISPNLTVNNESTLVEILASL